MRTHQADTLSVETEGLGARTTAQVRTAILTGSWREVVASISAHHLEDFIRRLLRWMTQAPDLEALKVRLDAVYGLNAEIVSWYGAQAVRFILLWSEIDVALWRDVQIPGATSYTIPTFGGEDYQWKEFLDPEGGALRPVWSWDATHVLFGVRTTTGGDRLMFQIRPRQDDAPDLVQERRLNQILLG